MVRILCHRSPFALHLLLALCVASAAHAQAPAPRLASVSCVILAALAGAACSDTPSDPLDIASIPAFASW